MTPKRPYVRCWHFTDTHACLNLDPLAGLEHIHGTRVPAVEPSTHQELTFVGVDVIP
jgi:hypothetical protein